MIRKERYVETELCFVKDIEPNTDVDSFVLVPKRNPVAGKIIARYARGRERMTKVLPQIKRRTKRSSTEKNEVDTL